MQWLFWIIVVVIYMTYVGGQAERQRQRQQAERQRRLAQAGEHGEPAGAEDAPAEPSRPPRPPRPLQPGPVMGRRPRMETVRPPARPQPAAVESRPAAPPRRRQRAAMPALTPGPDMELHVAPESGSESDPETRAGHHAAGAPPALAGLTPWQQAVVWSEVLSRPRSQQPWSGRHLHGPERVRR